MIDAWLRHRQRAAVQPQARLAVVFERPIAGTSLGSWGQPLQETLGPADGFRDALVRAGAARGLKADQVAQLLREVCAVVVGWADAGCDLTDLLADRGVSQGEHVLGVRTPHEYLASLTRFVTADVSGQVRADVLLLAGVEDHYVPFRQLGDQLNTLTGARSVTARVFTRESRRRITFRSATSPCPYGSCSIGSTGSTSGTCGAGF